MSDLGGTAMLNGQIVPFELLSDRQREEAAAVLMGALAHAPSAWHDMPSAMAVVQRCLADPERFAIAALEDARVVGWIGAIRHSDFQWELHPLVVEPKHQRRGYGTLLVETLEREASKAGICTIWLGTDDEFGGTNIYGVDLYPDVLDSLSRLAPATGHPFTFYRKLGFAIVGVLPDADGLGKHDILMAKRVE